MEKQTFFLVAVIFFSLVGLLHLLRIIYSLPIIRFYNWNPSSVSLGYYQDISKINIENCTKLKVDYVRRPTGGGSILHDYDKEITYSVVAPLSLYNRNLKEAYRKICEPLLSTLSYLSLNPYISNTNDIMVNNKKISGNAQTWRGGAFPDIFLLLTIMSFVLLMY